MNFVRLLLIFILANSALHASTRSSANYSITTEVTDAGGIRTTSANYTNDGGIGEPAGLASTTTPMDTVKGGYVGQLYDVKSLSIIAPEQNISGGTMLQLNAEEVLDDSSLLLVSASNITWSIADGSGATINSSGLLLASNPTQDSIVDVMGSYQGFSFRFSPLPLSAPQILLPPTLLRCLLGLYVRLRASLIACWRSIYTQAEETEE